MNNTQDNLNVVYLETYMQSERYFTMLIHTHINVISSCVLFLFHYHESLKSLYYACDINRLLQEKNFEEMWSICVVWETCVQISPWLFWFVHNLEGIISSLMRVPIRYMYFLIQWYTRLCVILVSFISTLKFAW